MEAFQIDKALGEILAYARQADQLIESAAPWKLVKLPEKAEELDEVLPSLSRKRFALSPSSFLPCCRKRLTSSSIN